MCCEGQESESGLTGWFRLRVSHKAAIKVLAGVAYFRVDWAGGPALPHPQGPGGLHPSLIDDTVTQVLLLCYRATTSMVDGFYGGGEGREEEGGKKEGKKGGRKKEIRKKEEGRKRRKEAKKERHKEIKNGKCCFQMSLM